MAERAADCLAKLGLDSGNHAAPDGYAAKQQHNVIFSSTIPTPLGHTEVDAIKVGDNYYTRKFLPFSILSLYILDYISTFSTNYPTTSISQSRFWLYSFR